MSVPTSPYRSAETSVPTLEPAQPVNQQVDQQGSQPGSQPVSLLVELAAGSVVIPLDNDRLYVVRLPAQCSSDDVELMAARLQHIRQSAPDPAHAPRFILCRHDVEVDEASAWDDALGDG